MTKWRNFPRWIEECNVGYRILGLLLSENFQTSLSTNGSFATAWAKRSIGTIILRVWGF